MTSNNWYHLLIETLISILFLLLIQSIYGLSSAPFLIGADIENGFLIDSKYNISVSQMLIVMAIYRLFIGFLRKIPELN